MSLRRGRLGWLGLAVLVSSCGGSATSGGAIGVEGDAGASDAVADSREGAALEGRNDASDASSPDSTLIRPDAGDASVGASADAPDSVPDVSADAIVDADVNAEARTDAPVDGNGLVDSSICNVDCTHLPNVRPGTVVSCVAGQCQVPPGSCVDGFAHCSVNPNDGCETDLSRPASCGSCFQSCSSSFPLCVQQGLYWSCSPVCTNPFPDSCGFSCTNFATDISNCGGCGHSCYSPFAQSACQQGNCVSLGCSDQDHADCTADPGCETQLGNALNCAGCGDVACPLANTLLTCSSDTHCATAICAPGFANCDATTPDCETSFATGGFCLPTYLGTAPFATLANDVGTVAIGSDGSYFLGGEFSGTVDFDPTAGRDIQTSVDANDGYVTKLDAGGNYAWTRTFVGRGNARIAHLAAASGGAVVAVGQFDDTIDLDPGTGINLHQTVFIGNEEPIVVKLAADGSLVWGGTFAGSAAGANGGATGVAVDSADNVYVAGSFSGTIDFDPGPGSDVHAAIITAGMVVKLNGSGTLAWTRIIDNGFCTNALNAIAVAPDGSAWAAGTFANGCRLGSPPDAGGTFPNGGSDSFVVAFEPNGDLRGTWTFGGAGDDSAVAIAAGSNGSIYVGGSSQRNMDFDPGPAIARRWVPIDGGYVSSLGSDGVFHWGQTFAAVPIVSLAATPDGVLVAGGANPFVFPSPPPGAFLTKLKADGTAAWTLAAGGSSTSAHAVAASGTGFALSGVNSGSADFDPSAGVDIVFGDATFLSRYTF
jgi:hypothetical protein